MLEKSARTPDVYNAVPFHINALLVAKQTGPGSLMKRNNTGRKVLCISKGQYELEIIDN